MSYARALERIARDECADEEDEEICRYASVTPSDTSSSTEYDDDDDDDDDDDEV